MTTPDTANTPTEFHLPSMTCGGCAGRVTRALQAADPQARVTVDLSRQAVQVQSALGRPALERALAAAGYAPAPV